MCKGLKLSAEHWLKTPLFNRVQVLDPDGWDRSNFEKSWAEPITLSEFQKRLNESTIQVKR